MKLLIDDFEHELTGLAESATEIKVLIAFLTEGGLNWLPDDRMPDSQFIVGIDFGITSPDALKALQTGRADVRVFHDQGRLFHPKAIHLKSETAEHLIVGSTNLTSSGISSNHELSTLSERNGENDQAFADFLAYFHSLKSHEGCSVPDEQFFRDYSQTPIQSDLASRLKGQRFSPPQVQERPTASIDASRAETLDQSIRRLAEEFPNLYRVQGVPLKDHHLKVWNDKEFRPLFQDIVTKVSQGRLKGTSQLNVGGKWRGIPHILAANESLEPEKNYRPEKNSRQRSRLVLQIHFSEDYKTVYFSTALHYYPPKSDKTGEMPPPVADRFSRLLQHLEHFSSKAIIDMPPFRHWRYKGDFLWSNPLISFKYQVASLPANEELCSDLELLANAMNGAMAID